MTWLVENWFIVFGIFAIAVIAAVAVYRFYGLPSKKQIETIKEWLLYACIQAETALGGGTGQLKLRYVYDLFITRFPAVAKVISFNVFSGWVDAALEQMKTLLQQNKAIQEVVRGETA
ncbi:hypothetical protein CLNEO_05340 [Anaerotignum neopropionicum]|uniref:Uncharacterized protein n=1 Tax=Anaerotignum neopropionicum TaxID=36847 RepID=A0A136WIN6_9FIRM|nr:hypothetical protein [Anaerotignum neopropionicum]KXL54428.1 hypothetical protein CLNEO_05340 [Anaerotignum neopropionicum]